MGTSFLEYPSKDEALALWVIYFFGIVTFKVGELFILGVVALES